MKSEIINRLCEVIINQNNRSYSNNNPILVDAHSEIGKQIISYGFAEKHLLTTLFNNIKNKEILNQTISLDIGANIGSHSIFFSNYFKRVLSFEPVKRTFKILELNTEKIKNINLFNLALSDTSKKSMIYVNHSASGLSSLENKSESFLKEEINTQILDDLNVLKKDEIGLIKIDVEGHEINVLKGGMETIKKTSPLLLIEYQGSHKKELLSLIKELLYDKFYVINGIGFYNKFKTYGILPLRILKLFFGFFVSPKYNLKLINDDLLEKIETEMLICVSPQTKIKIK